MKTLAEKISVGFAARIDGKTLFSNIPWTPHPVFAGVSMKHLVRGAETGGGLSAHLVRLEPSAVLESHIHESQWELHEVVDGYGRFLIGEKEVNYEPGTMGIIPMGAAHRVTAGEDGLMILAKFFPALL